MSANDPRAAIGVRPRTGWAAIVALAAEAAGPEVILRERAEISDPTGQISRFLFHSAAELGPARAQGFVASARRITDAMAADALARAIAQSRTAGFEPAAIAVVGATGTLPPLEQILRSHTAIHSAEGLFYAEAWERAGDAAGLRVRRLAEREVLDATATRRGITRDAADSALKACGKRVGAPWGADQRAAAAGAWSML